jgi:hypothetical protein
LSKGGRSLLKTGKGGGCARLTALKLKLLVLPLPEVTILDQAMSLLVKTGLEEMKEHQVMVVAEVRINFEVWAASKVPAS